ncbi:hypothetical protein SAMN05421766_104648 [Zobellia uliginosa]|uniref:Uncharacterized protein n=2 Tax=Zobellia uliginosa TaxID=143224 RepID=A0ABY1KX89_9FLAO|nr:hypothetical protein SAMN05421766_104648 [Zobellia uliginosa]
MGNDRILSSSLRYIINHLNQQIMRNLSLVWVAAMLLSVGSLFANGKESEKPSRSLAYQIAELLSDNELTVQEVDKLARVRFTLNERQEIVILAIDSDNEVVKAFVEERLEAKKVIVQRYKAGRTYTLPVRIAR